MAILERFPANQVRVSGLIGQRLDLTWKNSLLALDWDKDFLKPFQDKAAEQGAYIGLGKTFDALVRFAAYTNNAELLHLRRHVLDSLLAAQLPDGYLGLFVPASRITVLWDVHEQSYILLALIADWRYFDNKASLKAARRLGDYLTTRISRQELELLGRDHSVTLSTIGLDRAMLALHAATRDPRYLDFVTQVQDLPRWDLDIVEGRHGKIEGHAYAYFTKCLAQVELYEISGEDKLLSQTRRALDYLRKQGGLLITGSCSQTECWHSDQRGDGDLGETCATAYFIRLLSKLLQLEGDGPYGDLMERAIYNALFAAQSPDGRRLRYYVPFEGPRVYWDLDTYCCPGNFRRIMSELPEMVFYRQESGVVVNLYTPSRLTTELQPGLPLTIEQETDYPNSGEVTLRVSPASPTRFEVNLRIPAWCKQVAAAVNGDPVSIPERTHFLRLQREWKTGDTIELSLDMPWRLIRGLGLQEGKAAVMRGPMLFCLNPQRNPTIGETDPKSVEIDPSSLAPPIPDDTVRQHGVGCPLKGRADDAHDYDLVLTEFADPDGVATYFRAARSEIALEEDELLERGV